MASPERMKYFQEGKDAYFRGVRECPYDDAERKMCWTAGRNAGFCERTYNTGHPVSNRDFEEACELTRTKQERIE